MRSLDAVREMRECKYGRLRAARGDGRLDGIKCTIPALAEEQIGIDVRVKNASVRQISVELSACMCVCEREERR
jgi:hypothetical protein